MMLTGDGCPGGPSPPQSCLPARTVGVAYLQWLDNGLLPPPAAAGPGLHCQAAQQAPQILKATRDGSACRQQQQPEQPAGMGGMAQSPAGTSTSPHLLSRPQPPSRPHVRWQHGLQQEESSSCSTITYNKEVRLSCPSWLGQASRLIASSG